MLCLYGLKQGSLKNHRKPASRSRTAEDHDKYHDFVDHLNVRTDPSVNIVPAAAGSLIMVSLVLLQQLISYLPPALVLVLVLSIALGAVSYCVFIWLTQKEELGKIRRLTVV